MLDIEGIANLYNINCFINKGKISRDLEYAKLEEYHILNDPVQVKMNDYNVYYGNILKIINSYTNNTEIEPEIEYEPESKPEIVRERETKPIINDNLLAKTFDHTPKKKSQPIITKTDYEKHKINKLIYGSPEKSEENEGERLNMIESIESLREELNKLDIKVTNIPDIDENSTLYDVKNVYKMLLHKKNISVNSSMLNSGNRLDRAHERLDF